MNIIIYLLILTLIIMILIFFIYKINIFSIEKFDNISPETADIYKLKCGTTNSVLDTKCNLYKTELNNFISSLPTINSYTNRKKTLDAYDIYINTSKYILLITNIKSTLNALHDLAIFKKYILIIIYAFNNDIDSYNSEVSNTTLKEITDEYLISTALNDLIKIFNYKISLNSNYMKYTINENYTITTLTELNNNLEIDYNSKLDLKNSQIVEYNNAIKYFITLSKLDDKVTIKDIDMLLENVYNNPKKNYINTAINEATNLSIFIEKIIKLNDLFIDYCKTLIGISKTIDPKLLSYSLSDLAITA